MVTFDKLKLVADVNAIDIIDEEPFEKIEKAGFLPSYKFYQEVPFLLMIKIDYQEKEVVVEFCGKVLGKEYPKLISRETITKCFENINAMGFCRIDVDMMMDADVVKADVTKDVHSVDVPKLTTYIRSHISNYHQFISRILRNGNLVVEKNVVSRKTKKRMTIYDKGKEMHKEANKRFVEAYGLEHVFDDTCRFELNLNSKEQVRTALKIDNNKLCNVLNSSASPIKDFMGKIVIAENNSIKMTSKKEYLTMLVLKDCDYDLEKVEAKMRELHASRGTNITKIMEPFRAMMDMLQTKDGTSYPHELIDLLA